jgi:hypothetical protein
MGRGLSQFPFVKSLEMLALSTKQGWLHKTHIHPAALLPFHRARREHRILDKPKARMVRPEEVNMAIGFSTV